MSLLFNTLSRFVIAFLPSECLNFMVTVIVHIDFGAQENKVCHRFHCFPIYLPKNDETRGLILKLKLQYFGHLMQRADSFEKKP